MRALITRPEEDAAPLAQALADKGVDVVVEPLLVIRPIAEAAVDLDGVQALIFTSANGVRAFAALSDRRDIGVLTVGNGTAAAARAAGFRNVESAGGDVHDLARLVKERLDPKNGALFHAAGSAVAGDLAGQLGEAGYELRRAVLYEAKPAEALSEGVVAALAERAFDLVLFFSPRTAATFVELVRKADDPRVLAGCASAVALCLSPAVAEPAEAITWKDVRSAARPELGSMLQLVDQAVVTAAPAAPAAPPAEGGGAMSPPPLSPIAPPPHRNVGPLLAAALIAAVVALAVVATEPLWRPSLARLLPAGPAAVDPALTERLDALEQQNAELAQRLAAIDGAVNQLDARGAGASTDLDQLARRLDALERRSADIEQAVEAVRTQPVPDTPGEAAIPEEISRLPGRIAGLEQRLDEVSAATSAPAEPSPEMTRAVDGLRRQIEALQTTASGFEAWIDTVEARIEAAEELEPRIAALEQATSSAEQRAAGSAALALAVNQLQAAVAAARPYESELAALGEVAAGDPAVAAEVETARAALESHAGAGLPTLAGLRAAFPEVARAVVAASRAERAAASIAEATPGNGGDAAPGWLDQAMLRLSELVSVRPVGEDVAGDDASARVARAEAALGKGDLAGAGAELEALDGKAREAAAAWLAEAKARLEADAALAALQSAAVARLAPAGRGG